MKPGPSPPGPALQKALELSGKCTPAERALIEAVHRADLERWPENGWSLFGLTECFKARKSPEADQVEARFKKAWQHADTQLAATCLCVEIAKTNDKMQDC